MGAVSKLSRLLSPLPLLGIMVLSNGCVAARRPSLTAGAQSVAPARQASSLDTVALMKENVPASFSFQTGKGNLGSFKDAIRDSAEIGLSAPGVGIWIGGEVLSLESSGCGANDPRIPLVIAGAAGGATALGAALIGPAVGAKGLIQAMRRVSPEELAQRQDVLAGELKAMAEQLPFREALMEAGSEAFPGGFSTIQSQDNPAETKPSPAAILEARVDSVQLEKAGSSEGSFVLHIKTHARLVRVSDGLVCFEKQAEYRSGKDLFLDWTYYGSIQAVAETGYKSLARYYISQALLPVSHR